MSDRPPHDWISAYADGELAPAERADTERRLDAAREARDELSEIRSLGNLLRSLPERTLPPEFADAVLKRCERELLLSSSPPSAEADGTARSARSLSVAAGGLLTSAALLFLAVRLTTTPGERIHRPDAVEQAAAKTFKAADRATPQLAMQSEPLSRHRERPRAFEKNAAVGLDVQDAGAVRSNSAVAGAVRRAPGRPAESAADESRSAKPPAVARRGLAHAAKALQLDAAGGALPSAPRGGFGGASARDEIHVGDVLPYLEISGDRTAVIEVAVVDVRASANHFEALLTKHEVFPRGGRRAGGRVKNELKRNGNPAGPFPESATPKGPEMIAVYVESSRAQMAEVMKQLGRQTGSIHVSLKPPVPFSAVRLADANEPKSDALEKKSAGTALTLAQALGRANRQRQPTDNSRFSRKSGRVGAKSGQFGGGPATKSFNKKKPPAAANDSKRPGKIGRPGRQQSRPDASARSFRLRFEPAGAIAEGEAGREREPTSKPKQDRPRTTRRAFSQMRSRPPASTAAPLRVIFVFRKPMKDER